MWPWRNDLLTPTNYNIGNISNCASTKSTNSTPQNTWNPNLMLHGGDSTYKSHQQCQNARTKSVVVGGYFIHKCLKNAIVQCCTDTSADLLEQTCTRCDRTIVHLVKIKNNQYNICITHMGQWPSPKSRENSSSIILICPCSRKL